MTDTSRAITAPVLTDTDTQAAVNFLGALVRIRAQGEDTGGLFALLEHSGERGYMSPLHRHVKDEETFLVLEGELRVEVEDKKYGVGPGGLTLLPRGLSHGFVVTSPTARFLTLHTPAGFDQFIAEAWAPLGAAQPPPGPDPAELSRIAAKYGVEIVGPPLLP